MTQRRVSRFALEDVRRRAKLTFKSRIITRFFAQPMAWFMSIYLIVLILCAVFAGQISPYDPLQQNLLKTLQTPSSEFWFGTDYLGRDIFSRIIFGARASLFAALQATTIAVLIGVPFGLLAGYFGGWLDRIVGWFVDTLFALPLLLVAMSLIAIIGSGLVNAMFAVGIALSTNFIRLTRGLTIAEREELYIESAHIAGIRTPAILFRHLLPNILPALIIQTALILGVVILIESSLSFLGLGVPIGQPSWGQMLAEARLYIRLQPWLPVAPGLAITLTVLAFNLIGDALRDALLPNDVKPQAGYGNRPKPSHTTDKAPNTDALLSVRDLQVRFPLVASAKTALPQNMPRSELPRDFTILNNVDLDIYPGETFGLVGESGSGKSMTAATLLGMIPKPGILSDGQIWFQGRDCTHLSEQKWQTIRGREIGMIFQDPQSVLNPVLRVGSQIDEPMQIHLKLSKTSARQRTLDLLAQVGLPDPQRVYEAYPHQLSGGMAQRAVIARALSCNPSLLIADEPTTALDVTIQAQILDLLRDLQAEYGMAILLISHDLGVIGKLCERTAVMYAGQIVEQGTTQAIFDQPQHPYTRSLLAALPQLHKPGTQLPTIAGQVAPLHSLPQGCHFHPRCRFADENCRHSPIPMYAISKAHHSRCIHTGQLPTST